MFKSETVKLAYDDDDRMIVSKFNVNFSAKSAFTPVKLTKIRREFLPFPNLVAVRMMFDDRMIE